MTERTLNLKALSSALSLAKSTLSEYSKRSDFPCERTAAGKLFNLDDVAAWLALNGLGRRGKSPAKNRTSEPVAVVSALAKDSDAHIQLLRTGRATAVEIAEVFLQLKSAELANAATNTSSISKPLTDGMAGAIERLTLEKQKHIEVSVRMAELVDRGTVIEVIGTISTRLVQVGDSFCTAAQQQFDIWLGDPVFISQSIEFRRREVLAWMKRQWESVRKLESDEVVALLKDVLQASANSDGEVSA